MRSRRFVRAATILFLLVLPFIVLRQPIVNEWLSQLVAYMRGTGVAGVALFLGVEVVLLSLTTPIWLLSGLAGYAYGFMKGVLIACPGVALGATFAFLLGRVSVGKLLSARAGEGAFWKAVDRAVRMDGLKITVLLRLTVAAPQNLMNYLLSATPIRARDFALGTFLGLIPITVVQVYVGSCVQSLLELRSGGGTPGGKLAYVLLAVGAVLTIGALVFTSRIARRALDKTLADSQKTEGGVDSHGGAA